VGAFPLGWSEWNDVHRRTLRRFWRGDGGVLGDLAHAMTGSANLFQGGGRGPRASVNHITVHDGFTLADLVTYEGKYNEANGEDNRDGSNENISLNCGVEGPTDDPDVLECRRRLRRNQLACLLLAHGVPLMLAGDEVGNSQQGNNNAYCQDNETGWVDWSGLGRPEDDLTDFVARLVALRRQFPQLRPRHWVEGRRADGSYGALWLTPAGEEMTEQDWNFPEGRFLAYLLAHTDAHGAPLYMVLNGAPDPVEFKLPGAAGGSHWSLVLDTSFALAQPKCSRLHPGATLQAPARSVLVFAGSP
jgi:glycogen operon protein